MKIRRARSAPGRVGRRAGWALGIGGLALVLASCGGGPLAASDEGSRPAVPPPPPPPPDPSVVTPCPPAAIAPRRVERMTLLQTTNAVRDLLGDDIADALVAQQGLGAPENAFFPPLDSTREGDTVIASRLQQIETMVATGAQYVHDNYADIVGCDADVDCVRQFIAGFAERAYRRPLAATESGDLDQLVSDLLAAGADAQEEAQYGVYAVLMAPQFIYRYELGEPSPPSAGGGEVALTPYEMATQLSFMLTDGPPDAALLDAAAQGTLSTSAGVSDQVNRLLATPAVHRTLANAVSVYFKLHQMVNVVIDPLKVPEFNPALADAMTTEGSLFLDEVLWHRNLRDLLTATTSFVNSGLATVVYGIPVPDGANATTFVRVELPADQRAGLLTRAAFITARARIDIGSLVARGLAIQEALACDIAQPAPDSFAEEEVKIIQATATWTQRARAELRMSMPQCAACHASIDPLGMPLESYDIIGRFRTQDEQGQPIDPTSTLTPPFGAQPVRDAVDLSQKIASSPRFTACLTKSFLQYALTDDGTAPVAIDRCAVATAAARFAGSADQTFSGLIREVLLSPAVSRRRMVR